MSSLFDRIRSRRTESPAPGPQAPTEGPLAVVQTARSCGPVVHGDARAGRKLIRGFTQRAEGTSGGAPGPGYDPVAAYDELWPSRDAKLTQMRGYQPGAHTGRVKVLTDWQPNLRFFDLIVLNTSAGKDSMAAMELVTRAAEDLGIKGRLVALHSDLGRVEHPEVTRFARDQAEALGLPFHVVHREVHGVRKDLLQRFIENMQIKVRVRTSRPSHKVKLQRLGFEQQGIIFLGRFDLSSQFDQVEGALQAMGLKSTASGSAQDGEYRVYASRGFPGFGTRYCTSEFKTGEISKWVTAWAKGWKQEHPYAGRPPRILHILGLRAQESDARSKAGFGWKKRPTSGQHVYQWLPIQGLSTEQVWDVIAASPMAHHPAYDVGFERLSCRLCPLAGDDDVGLAALVYPQLADEIVAIEERYGHKFKETKSLAQIRAAALSRPQLVERARSARESLAHLHERERALGSMAVIGRQYAESHGIERCPVHG